MSRLLRSLSLPCIIAAAFTTTGCDASLLGLGGGDTALVQVLVTHHGTAEDGKFPDHRSGLGDQKFETDEGWTITLTDAHIVTAQVAVMGCDGTQIELERYWGALPEDIRSDDLRLFTFGGVEVDAGNYCGAVVTYGPYAAPTKADRAASEIPDVDDDLVGATVNIVGHAELGDVLIPFEIRSSERLVVEAPLPDGGLEVSGDEPFPVELTVAKTYDRMFDGIDFAEITPEDLDNTVLALLSAETRLTDGTVVSID